MKHLGTIILLISILFSTVACSLSDNNTTESLSSENSENTTLPQSDESSEITVVSDSETSKELSKTDTETEAKTEAETEIKIKIETDSDASNSITYESDGLESGNYEFISQEEKNSWRPSLISVLSKSRVHEFEPYCPGSISVGLMDINLPHG